MLDRRVLLSGIALLTLTVAACTNDTSLGNNPARSGGTLGGLGGTGQGGRSGPSAGGAAGIGTGGGIGGGGTIGQGGAIGKDGGGGSLGSGGAGAGDAGTAVCCNALYCPSGYTLVGPVGSGSCPAGYECSQFTSCGCNLVLCARLPGADGGTGTGGAGAQPGSGGTGGGGGAGGMTGGGGASGGAGGTAALDARQDGPIVCGNATCAAGEYCCNAACDLCAPVGYGCIQACGSDASPDKGGSDVASLPPSIDGPLATFCTGDLPKAVVNGTESTPTVTGSIVAYDCCDGGEFTVVTPSFGYKIYVMWQAQVGTVSWTSPATVDLANPSKGWGARVELSCSSGMSCYPPPDSYTSGLEGVLQVADSSLGFDMSVCLHLSEPAGSPHPLLHSLDLYATHVRTN